MASTSSPPPDPKLILFARGVIAILNLWPVLRLAVQESWGGPHGADKRAWIVSTIIDAFEADPLDQDQVEDLLLDSMMEEFETEVDDDSSQIVARDILNVWKAACEGHADVVLKLEADAQKLGTRILSSARKEGNGDEEWVDEDAGGDDMDIDETPQLMAPRGPEAKPEPVLDEDGFELVQKSRKARH